jgi:hypothetical protein
VHLEQAIAQKKLHQAVDNSHISHEDNIVAPPRFIKPPQPTLEWQQVLLRKRQDNKVRGVAAKHSKAQEIQICFTSEAGAHQKEL